MAVEPLIRALEQEAREEARAILDRARREADRLVEEAAAEEEERLGRALAARAEALRAEVDRRREEARAAAHRRVLEERRRLLDRIFDAATARLPEAFAGPDRETLARCLLAAALDCVGDRPVEVRCPRALAETVRVLVGTMVGGAEWRVVVDDTVGSGVLVVADDGRLWVEGTLEARLATLRSRLEIDVAGELDELTGGGGPEASAAPSADSTTREPK